MHHSKHRRDSGLRAGHTEMGAIAVTTKTYEVHLIQRATTHAVVLVAAANSAEAERIVLADNAAGQVDWEPVVWDDVYVNALALYEP